VPASPGPELPGARWLRRPFLWRSGLAPHSRSGRAGRGGAGLSESCGWPDRAVAPPGWASEGEHGPPTATQGGGPWSPRAPRLNINRARRYWPGEPWWKPQRAVPGVKVERYLPSDGPRAALGRTSASAHACARRVGPGRRFPRLCYARRAYRAGRASLAPAAQGPFFHGCAGLPRHVPVPGNFSLPSESARRLGQERTCFGAAAADVCLGEGCR
jgi:hypothetical protein